MKVPIEERALIDRLRRVLAKEGQILRKCKATARGHSELGHWYTVNTGTSAVSGRHIDIERLARRVGALKDYEILAELNKEISK